MPKSNVVSITAAGSGVRVIAKGVSASGTPTSIDYTLTYDGKRSRIDKKPEMRRST